MAKENANLIKNMNLEARVFRIPADIVEEIQITIQNRGLSGFIESAFREMQDKHPILSFHLDRPLIAPHDWNAYRNGKALGYFAISSTLSRLNMVVDLTTDDLEIHHQSVKDYIGVDESDEVWPKSEFQQRMKSSESFMNYVDSQSRSYHYQQGGQSFSRGIYDSIMPILAVIDRKALQEAIWREEEAKT